MSNADPSNANAPSDCWQEHRCDICGTSWDDALAWRGAAEQLAARLRVLGEHSAALDNFDRLMEANR